ncbi:Small nuclear ribonucleoprotein SmD3a-like protein [Drosera capensis]
MSWSLGIPVKLMYESTGHVVTVELKTGELYRGTMVECEDNWNCQLESITFTSKDGKTSDLEQVFIRGSRGKSTSLGVGCGRAVAMRAKAQVVHQEGELHHQPGDKFPSVWYGLPAATLSRRGTSQLQFLDMMYQKRAAAVNVF